MATREKQEQFVETTTATMKDFASSIERRMNENYQDLVNFAIEKIIKPATSRTAIETYLQCRTYVISQKNREELTKKSEELFGERLSKKVMKNIEDRIQITLKNINLRVSYSEREIAVVRMAKYSDTLRGIWLSDDKLISTNEEMNSFQKSKLRSMDKLISDCLSRKGKKDYEGLLREIEYEAIKQLEQFGFSIVNKIIAKPEMQESISKGNSYMEASKDFAEFNVFCQKMFGERYGENCYEHIILFLKNFVYKYDMDFEVVSDKGITVNSDEKMLKFSYSSEKINRWLNNSTAFDLNLIG